MNSKIDLIKLKYIVYGLGNREYRHFCKIGIDFHEKLKEKGAIPLMKLWKGDDSKDINFHFTVWKRKFWKKFPKNSLEVLN